MEETTEFTFGKSKAELEALALRVSNSLKGISNHDVTYPLSGKTLKISEAIDEVLSLSETGLRVINTWMKNITEKMFFKVKVSEILDLRQSVLRPGLPIGTAKFDGDKDKDTFHFACYILENIPGPVCCVSYMLVPWNGQPAYQLRGMATRLGLDGKGIGKALLEFSEKKIVEETGIKLLWCNARLESTGFYEKYGWTFASEVFDIPEVGPHRKMIKQL